MNVVKRFSYNQNAVLWGVSAFTLGYISMCKTKYLDVNA